MNLALTATVILLQVLVGHKIMWRLCKIVDSGRCFLEDWLGFCTLVYSEGGEGALQELLSTAVATNRSAPG